MVLLNKLSAAYSPQEAADRALLESVTVTGDSVKGAHDAQFIIDGGKAYIVYECNDIQAGENAGWTFIYCAMSIVDVKTRAVEKGDVRSAHSKKIRGRSQSFFQQRAAGCTAVDNVLYRF